MLQNVFGIAAGAVLHLFGIPFEAFGRVFCGKSKSGLDLEFAKRMGVGTFRSVVASFILIGFAEPC